MAASTITPDTWINDTGTFLAPNGDGTVLANTVLQNHIYARINQMFAGAGAYATFTLGGKFSAEGFGSHLFSAGGTGLNSISIRNTAAGTGNSSAILIGNDADGSLALLSSYSSTYTPATNFAKANGTVLYQQGVGGLSLAAVHASGVLRFYSGGDVERMRIHASGGVSVAGTTDPGADVFSVGTWVRLTLGSMRISDGSTRGLLQAFDTTYRLLQLDGSLIQFFASSVEKMRLHASGGVSIGSTVDPGAGCLTVTHTAAGVSTIGVTQSTSGTGSYSQLLCTDDAANSTYILQLTTGYTSSVQYQANGGILEANGPGGLSISAAHASGVVRFYSAGSSELMRITSTGISMFTTTTLGANIFRVEGTLSVLTNINMDVGAAVVFSPAGIFLDGTGGLWNNVWNVTASAANAHVGNSDYLRLVSSLRAIKHDIHTISSADGLAAVLALNPVFYRSRVDEDQRQWPGFIAEEVEDAVPHLATYATDGKLQSVAYDRVCAYLVAAVQKLEQELRQLKEQ